MSLMVRHSRRASSSVISRVSCSVDLQAWKVLARLEKAQVRRRLGSISSRINLFIKLRRTILRARQLDQHLSRSQKQQVQRKFWEKKRKQATPIGSLVDLIQPLWSFSEWKRAGWVELKEIDMVAQSISWDSCRLCSEKHNCWAETKSVARDSAQESESMQNIWRQWPKWDSLRIGASVRWKASTITLSKHYSMSWQLTSLKTTDYLDQISQTLLSRRLQLKVK